MTNWTLMFEQGWIIQWASWAQAQGPCRAPNGHGIFKLSKLKDHCAEFDNKLLDAFNLDQVCRSRETFDACRIVDLEFEIPALGVSVNVSGCLCLCGHCDGLSRVHPPSPPIAAGKGSSPPWPCIKKWIFRMDGRNFSWCNLMFDLISHQVLRLELERKKDKT